MDTSNTDTAGEYEVGYGKTPKHSRWKKGQSGNLKGRTKKPKQHRLGDVIATKLEEEIKVKGDRREGRLSTLRLLLRRMVEKAATGDNRAAQAIVKISEMSETLPAPNEPDWLILTYEEGMAAGRDSLTEEFYVEQERKVAQWRAELRKGGRSVQQMLQLELMRRVPAMRNGQPVKVPMMDVISSRLLREASTDVQAFKLLLKIMPQKNYKPDYRRVEILRPTKRDVERWGATAKPSTESPDALKFGNPAVRMLSAGRGQSQQVPQPDRSA